MARTTIRLQKAWALVSEKGLAKGLRAALRHWASDKFRVDSNAFASLSFVLNDDRPATLPPRKSRQLIIHWLIPPFALGSGGHQTMFTTIAELEKRGHTNRVYLTGAGAADAALSTSIARRYYAPIRCEVELFQGVIPNSDALVATSWETAYAARAVANTVRKFYFVQDLEFEFFPEGSHRELARETYRWGFFGITAGDWIARTLNTEFGMTCVPFHFWYDARLYFPRQNRPSRPRVLFYARPRTERRGFELGLLALGLVAKRLPDVEVVMVGMTRAHIDLPFQATYPGVIPASQLPEFYAEASVALVLSHTNLSLVPLELMACGCPVVSNRGANVEWLLSDENCALADPRPDALAERMIELLEDAAVRGRLISAGLAFAQRQSYNAEMDKIEAAFETALSTVSEAIPL